MTTTFVNGIAFASTTTFNNSLPTSTQTPSSASQLITKTYADTSYMPLTIATATTTSSTAVTIATIPVSTSNCIFIYAFFTWADASANPSRCGGGHLCTSVSNLSGTLSILPQGGSFVLNNRQS